MAEKDKLTPESDPAATPEEFGDLAGENLADELTEPGAFELSADEDEAEELDPSTEPVPDDFADDPEQLTDAEAVAAQAKDSRPVRKQKAAVAAPTKKGQATRRQAQAVTPEGRRTSPVQFVRESAAELRKVVWPTATQLRQYFVVVLVFVLVVIAFVSALDLFFGWGLLRIFG